MNNVIKRCIESSAVTGYMFLLGYVLFVALMPPGFAGVPYSVLALFVFLSFSPLACCLVATWRSHAMALGVFWFVICIQTGLSGELREDLMMLTIIAMHCAIQIGVAVLVQKKKASTVMSPSKEDHR